MIDGKALKYGNDVNTDVIIPARYLNTNDSRELAKHAMEDLDKDFLKKLSPGDIVVAGKNFGCGSSREHAPIALKAAGVSAVVAESFARIFYRNSINIGLVAIEDKQAAKEIRDKDRLKIEPEKGTIIDKTTNKTYKTKPLPAFVQEISKTGGLIPYLKKKLGK